MKANRGELIRTRKEQIRDTRAKLLPLPRPCGAPIALLWCSCYAPWLAPWLPAAKALIQRLLLREHLHRLAPGASPGSPAGPVGRHHRRPSRAICATSQLRPT